MASLAALARTNLMPGDWQKVMAKINRNELIDRAILWLIDITIEFLKQ